MRSIYHRQIVVNVSRTNIDVPGMWPGWDTAIGIINHVHPATRRKDPFQWVHPTKMVADRIGERIRAMREEGGRALSEEFYSVLDQFGMLNEEVRLKDGSPVYTDVTSGQELAHHLEAEALVSWARGPSLLECGPYRIQKSFLDGPRQQELTDLEQRAQRYADAYHSR